MKSSLIILVICLVYVSATPINNNQEDASEKNLLNIVNEFDKEQSVYLFGGLSIEKSKNVRSMKSLNNNEKFVDRIERYFNTHELKFNWSEDKENEIESGRNQLEEESRTRKLKKILIPLLLAIKLKLGLIVPILLLAIKAISLKGLAAGFLALLLSGASFFKDMMSPKKKDHITTAYITGHPINAEIVHSTDWHRNGQASAQELAYAGYNYHTLPVTNY